jgi:ribosomal protein S18 acetylase RimI-like enzyme
LEAAAAISEAAFAAERSIYRPTDETVARQSPCNDETTRLVADLNGQIVGTVQYDRQDQRLHLVGLATHPRFQRMGVAQAMINWIADRAGTLGSRLIVLDTIREVGAVPLFEKLGFHVVSESTTTRFVNDDGAQLHEVRMHRNLP